LDVWISFLNKNSKAPRLWCSSLARLKAEDNNLKADEKWSESSISRGDGSSITDDQWRVLNASEQDPDEVKKIKSHPMTHGGRCAHFPDSYNENEDNEDNEDDENAGDLQISTFVDWTQTHMVSPQLPLLYDELKSRQKSF